MWRGGRGGMGWGDWVEGERGRGEETGEKEGARCGGGQGDGCGGAGEGDAAPEVTSVSRAEQSDG